MESKICNSRGEKIDALVEGTNNGITIVMAHGFGTQKDEYAGFFTDISKSLSPLARVVRFDFSGYGKSEGREEDSDLNKMADDLASVLAWVRSEFGGRIMIIAHSLGTLVTRVLSPDGIEKSFSPASHYRMPTHTPMLR